MYMRVHAWPSLPTASGINNPPLPPLQIQMHASQKNIDSTGGEFGLLSMWKTNSLSVVAFTLFNLNYNTVSHGYNVKAVSFPICIKIKGNAMSQNKDVVFFYSSK